MRRRWPICPELELRQGNSINDQWRICFEWLEGSLGLSNIEIVDYR
jgi:plasmid maintenance system killer protein